MPCTQFPLQLGAACTIHKAQSLTFGKIVVDMFTWKNPPKCFWIHEHYVALSRCTSLECLFIVNMNEEHICQSEQVRHYLSEEKRELELCYTPSYQVRDSIKIMYHNVCFLGILQRAIMNNQHILGCDINILAETWYDNAYQLPNFKLWRMDSTVVKSHRGMIVHVKDDMSHVSITQTPFLEICKCRVPYKNQLVLVSLVSTGLQVVQCPCSKRSYFNILEHMIQFHQRLSWGILI